MVVFRSTQEACQHSPKWGLIESK
uniref:Uncharacterized protein n=1 Tax=Anguilla anguilla TaxID=7936 RepID=A0A0E9P9L2_ANGAN